MKWYYMPPFSYNADTGNEENPAICSESVPAVNLLQAHNDTA